MGQRKSAMPIVGDVVSWQRVVDAIARRCESDGAALQSVSLAEFCSAIENEGLRTLLSNGLHSVHGEDHKTLSDHDLDQMIDFIVETE